MKKDKVKPTPKKPTMKELTKMLTGKSKLDKDTRDDYLRMRVESLLEIEKRYNKLVKALGTLRSGSYE
jgi:hypothetical protein